MQFKITPFCLTHKSIMADPMATFASESRHMIQPLSGYEERQTIVVDAEDAHAACEMAWQTFQNIDENWQTPDRGRSLMVGDMVRLENEKATTWWICCSFGWTQTLEPGENIKRIGD